MAKFVCIIYDKDPEILTKALYYSHVNYVRTNSTQGRLLLVGPLVGEDKLLQIVEADSAVAAAEIVSEDPYIKKRHYRSFQCYEFLESNSANNWLMDTPRIKEMLRWLK